MGQSEKPESHFVRNPVEQSGNDNKNLSAAESAAYPQKGVFTEKKKYHIKSGYILREIAGDYAIIPVNEECMITNAVMIPNDTAVFFWKAFQQISTIEDIVQKGISEYEAAEDTIRNAAQRFVNDALKYQILEEVD